MESQLHLIFKRRVMNELFAEGYILYTEPLASPVKWLYWSMYRPDVLGIQVNHNTVRLVIVECETSPTKTRVIEKSERIKDVLSFQKRLNAFHHLRLLMVIPPITFRKINCIIIRSFWEIWIVNHQGVIIHKIPKQSCKQVL